MLTFRTKVTPEDLQKVREISVSTGFFDEEVVEIPVAMVDDALYEINHPEDEDLAHDINFIFAEIDGKTAAYACYGHIADSNSTYELHWLATHNDYRGQGIGKQLINELIKNVKADGGTKLYVKTDSTEQYKATRHFYHSCGFTLEAILKQYYEKNDDCCIYAMNLDGEENSEDIAAAE